MGLVVERFPDVNNSELVKRLNQKCRDKMRNSRRRNIRPINDGQGLLITLCQVIITILFQMTNYHPQTPETQAYIRPMMAKVCS